MLKTSLTIRKYDIGTNLSIRFVWGYGDNSPSICSFLFPSSSFFFFSLQSKVTQSYYSPNALMALTASHISVYNNQQRHLQYFLNIFFWLSHETVPNSLHQEKVDEM